MQLSTIKTFKNELNCYNDYLKQEEKLKELIEDTYYKLSGVKGCDPSKIPTHALPNKDVEYKMRAKIEEYKKDYKLLESKLNYLDSKLELITDKELRQQIKSVYIDGVNMDKVSRQYYMAKSTLRYRINNELERILKN